MPCLAHLLVVVGGVFQIVGVAWAVVEVKKVRRSLAELRKVAQEIAAEIRSLLHPPPERQHAVNLAGVISSSGGGMGNLTVTGTVGPPPTLQERVERTEAEIRRLDEQATADRQEMRAEAKRAKEHADAIEREMRELIEAQERQRREAQEAAQRLQRRIAPMLIGGLAISIVGSVIPC